MDLPHIYAHSHAEWPREQWHLLEEHLRETARLAESFASSYAPGWGHLAGLWHDLGKYQIEFQNKITKDSEAHCRVDHSIVGALAAFAEKDAILPPIIAGHHGGLPDLTNLKARLERETLRLAPVVAQAPAAALLQEKLPQCPPWLRRGDESLAFWIRMIFSALVDADFLDTEAFYERRHRDPIAGSVGLSDLKAQLDLALQAKTEGAAPTPVNAMRARVLSDCRAAATRPPGLFSLTVPTGGGKTLASLAFALDHAVTHGLDRIIVVIPFTSILEQTADEYRKALGRPDAVLEHHSNVDSKNETAATRLACENWDAPIVVTTGVQFFESLYANRTSKCRKLHNIARSVVVFDEVQTFPIELREPVCSALRQLVTRYGSSIVLCTATQPALNLPAVTEIVQDVDREFAAVANRTRVRWPESEVPTTWGSLADEVRELRQVLVIVHRRKDAEELARLLGNDVIHLSARMCPEHRSQRIAEIKQRLLQGEACVTVSTQLVEAGVDIDFPVVYRAFAGADAMAQAAGRCNRHGTQPVQGELRVFFAESKPPVPILRMGQETARTMWKEGTLDLVRPATFRDYFKRLYQRTDADPGVLTAERELRFEEAARLFRIIEEQGETLIAPYGDAEAVVTELRDQGITRPLLRRLQSYSVTLYDQEIRTLKQAGSIELLIDKLWTVLPPYRRIYSEQFGFGWQGPIAAEPGELIA